METVQDAFGHAIHDYFRGKNVEEAGAFGCRTWFSEYENWFEREKKAIAHAKGRVLDIGCGAGRHALYLQQRGHDVVALDTSPLGIKVCRQRGVKDAKVLPITRLSHRLGVFDTILMLGNNFGLVGNRKRARWLLRRLKRVTPPHGIILAGDGFPKAPGQGFRDQIMLNLASGKMPGECVLKPKYRHYQSAPLPWLYASKDDVVQIVEGTGWRVMEFCEDDTDAFVALLEKCAAGGRS